MMYHFILLC